MTTKPQIDVSQILGHFGPYGGRFVPEALISALEELEEQPARWVDLHWQSGRHAPAYSVTLDVAISNDAGVLGRICTVIGEQKANISDLKFIERKPDFYRLLIDVDLRDVEHFHMVMTALEAETDVAQVGRVRNVTRKP
jgi:GTP pyrophosphokinase/guanosine-3',5'-bis(diphosphate) 3'-pyrophosphohydrolase